VESPASEDGCGPANSSSSSNPGQRGKRSRSGYKFSEAIVEGEARSEGCERELSIDEKMEMEDEVISDS